MIFAAGFVFSNKSIEKYKIRIFFISKHNNKLKITMLKNSVEKFIDNIKIFLVIKPLQFFHNKNYYEKKLNFMRNLSENTVGNDVARMLDKKGLKLIPKFENHDLRHLILGYEMTTEDEIKMQMYLFGNGNYSISCLLFLCSGLLFPNLWKSFYEEYKKGQNAPSILKLSVDSCMHEQTATIKKVYKKIIIPVLA